MAANIPVLPVKKGMYRTKWHMVFYILGFIPMAGLLTWFHYTGYVYLAATSLLGGVWLWLCFKGFKSSNEHLWAKQMFRLSLLVITAVCIVIPLDLRV